MNRIKILHELGIDKINIRTIDTLMVIYYMTGLSKYGFIAGTETMITDKGYELAAALVNKQWKIPKYIIEEIMEEFVRQQYILKKERQNISILINEAQVRGFKAMHDMAEYLNPN